jgi:hypothetical protein
LAETVSKHIFLTLFTRFDLLNHGATRFAI